MAIGRNFYIAVLIISLLKITSVHAMSCASLSELDPKWHDVARNLLEAQRTGQAVAVRVPDPDGEFVGFPHFVGVDNDRPVFQIGDQWFDWGAWAQVRILETISDPEEIMAKVGEPLREAAGKLLTAQNSGGAVYVSVPHERRDLAGLVTKVRLIDGRLTFELGGNFMIHTGQEIRNVRRLGN